MERKFFIVENTYTGFRELKETADVRGKVSNFWDDSFEDRLITENCGIDLLSFGESLTSSRALAKLQEESLPPGTFRQMLFLLAECADRLRPLIQVHRPLVAFGTEKGKYVPVILRHHEHFEVNEGYMQGGGWPDGTWFIAARPRY